MKTFFMKGKWVVILSAVFIVLFGTGLLVPALSPSSSNDEITEIKLEEGGYVIREYPDVVFGMEISYSVTMKSGDDENIRISFYFLDEDNYEELMEWLEEENGTAFTEKLDDLEFLHTEHCSEEQDFQVTLDYDGDVHLLILNRGSVQEISVKQRSKETYPFGVCFLSFVIMSGIGVLMMRATRDIVE